MGRRVSGVWRESPRARRVDESEPQTPLIKMPAKPIRWNNSNRSAGGITFPKIYIRGKFRNDPNTHISKLLFTIFKGWCFLFTKLLIFRSPKNALNMGFNLFFSLWALRHFRYPLMYLAKRKYFNNIRFFNYASYFIQEVDLVYALRNTVFTISYCITVPNRLLYGFNPVGVHSR